MWFAHTSQELRWNSPYYKDQKKTIYKLQLLDIGSPPGWESGFSGFFFCKGMPWESRAFLSLFVAECSVYKPSSKIIGKHLIVLLPCWTSSTVALFWVCRIYTGNSLLPTMNKGACLGILLGSGPVVCSKARVNRQRMWMWLVMVGVVVSPLLIKTLGFLPMANVYLHYNIISYMRHAAHSYRKQVRFITHSFCV